MMLAVETTRDASDAGLDLAATAVRVIAPARLHLGFLDPGASLGRRFGSLGLVIDGFDTELELAAAPHDTAQAAGPREQRALARVEAALAAMRRATGRRTPLALALRQVPPAHAGFGTGTQLALAVARAFAALHGLPLATPELARLTGRGLRSGVGIAGFDAGGLLLDAGPGQAGGSAPLLARVDLPAAWRVLLVLDQRADGLHGPAEQAALAALPPLPEAQAAAICHDVLMRVLPGAIEADFGAFAAGLSRLQRVLGDHFAPAQPGGAYTSPAVGRLLGWLAARTPAAIGQSSWGPTGFAVLPSADGIDPLLAEARAAGLLEPPLQTRLVRARSHGAVVTDPR